VGNQKTWKPGGNNAVFQKRKNQTKKINQRGGTHPEMKEREVQYLKGSYLERTGEVPHMGAKKSRH